jgi:hypothetical protein
MRRHEVYTDMNPFASNSNNISLLSALNVVTIVCSIAHLVLFIAMPELFDAQFARVGFCATDQGWLHTMEYVALLGFGWTCWTALVVPFKTPPKRLQSMSTVHSVGYTPWSTLPTSPPFRKRQLWPPSSIVLYSVRLACLVVRLPTTTRKQRRDGMHGYLLRPLAFQERMQHVHAVS